MAANKLELFKLDFDIEALTDNTAKVLRSMKDLDNEQKNLKKSSIDLSAEIKNQKKELKDLEKSTGGQSTAYKDAKVKLSELEKQYEDNSRAMVKNQSELKATRKEYNLGIKAIDAYADKQRTQIAYLEQTDGSLDQISAAISKNTQAYYSLSKTERENSEIGGKLKTLIAQQREEYKKLNNELGDTRVNVGGYKDEMKAAIRTTFNLQDATTALLGPLGSFSPIVYTGIKHLKAWALGQDAATVASGKFSKSAKVLRIALLSTGIPIVVAAVATLISFFKKTQAGADKLSIVMAQVGAVVDALVGKLINIGSTLSKIGGVIKGVIKGQIGVKDAFKEGANAVKGFTTDMGEAMRAAEKLKQMEIDLRKATIEHTASQAELSSIIEEQSTIADDATRSFAERETAAEKARKAQEKQANDAVDIAKREYDIVKEQVKQAQDKSQLTDELRQKEADAYAEYVKAESDKTKLTLDNETRINQLKQDRLERDLDILLDGYDNQKTINEKIIADDTRTFTERQAVLDETRRLGEESFAKQIATVQEFTGKSIDANALVSEADANVLNQKIRDLGLSEIMEGRLLEMIRDRKTATQDLATTQQELSANQAQFLIDQAEKELALYIAQNQSKINANTLLNDTLIAAEEQRLADIYNKEVEHLNSLDLTESERQLRKLELDNQYLAQKAELTKTYEQQEAERKQLNWENEMMLRTVRGESEFALRRAELDKQYQAEIAYAKKIGADTADIEARYAEEKKGIEGDALDYKLGLASDAFNNMATILGKESKAGKAAAIAAATIDTFKAANAAYASLSVIPMVGPALGALAAGAAVTSGIANIKKIKNTNADVPKAERGIAINIGGKRHSSGGTKFYGTDGTQFEAEKGETMFVLNRLASAAIAPSLSRINQMYGGVPLTKSSTYLAQGGAISRLSSGSTTRVVNNTVTNATTIDYDRMGAAVAQANKSLPHPVTLVQDIISEVNSYNQVVDGATI